jgi:hypothetical protein
LKVAFPRVMVLIVANAGSRTHSQPTQDYLARNGSDVSKLG